jgi:hypothetical protein
VDLIRPAASPLEAACRLISGKLSADDPKESVAVSELRIVDGEFQDEILGKSQQILQVKTSL